jgi:hypothetical protein
MTGKINHDRRRFLGATGAAALGIGAAQIATIGAAKAQTGGARAVGQTASGAGTNTSFGPVKQIDAGVLNVGYVEAGPADGQPVILMHGFPYDIHSYVEVTPLLAAEGYRVIVRISAATARRPSGQPIRRGMSIRRRSLSTSSP